MRDDRKHAGRVEIGERKSLQCALIDRRGAVRLVLQVEHVEMLEAKPGITNLRLEPGYRLPVCVDPGIKIDIDCQIHERACKPYSTAEIEKSSTVQGTPVDASAQGIQQEMPCHLWREFRDSGVVEVEGWVDIGELPLCPFAPQQGFEVGVTCKINHVCLQEPALEFDARARWWSRLSEFKLTYHPIRLKRLDRKRTAARPRGANHGRKSCP